MFDVGWGELFLIGIVALIVVGPKDLPGLFRTLGQFTGKARMMARDFQRTLEQAADEAGVSEVQKTLRGVDQSLSSATDAARRFADLKSQSVPTSAAEARGKAAAATAAAPEPVAEAGIGVGAAPEAAVSATPEAPAAQPLPAARTDAVPGAASDTQRKAAS